MQLRDFLELIHPVLVITIVFPLVGLAVYFAWQTRQRRLQARTGQKPPGPALAGITHMRVGHYLTGAVVGVCLVALGFDTLDSAIQADAFVKEPVQMGFLGLMFIATLAALGFLYISRPWGWRLVFALLTEVGVLVLGFQDTLFNRPEQWIFRRDYEWQFSHFYSGLVVTTLMIISLGIVPQIYRSSGWRTLHITLNTLALLFFLGQAMTGTRDLIEIPLTWQTPYIEQLYNLNCNVKPCQVTLQTKTGPGSP